MTEVAKIVGRHIVAHGKLDDGDSLTAGSLITLLFDFISGDELRNPPFINQMNRLFLTSLKTQRQLMSGGGEIVNKNVSLEQINKLITKFEKLVNNDINTQHYDDV